MYELKKQEYKKINDMFDRQKSSNAFMSVVDGYSPGSVYVDDLHHPTTALIWSKGLAGFGILGNKLSRYFVENFIPFTNDCLIPDLMQQGHTHFEVNCIDETLNSAFEELILNKKPHQWKQNIYVYNGSNMADNDCEDKTYIHIVNKELLESGVNTNLIKETINRYWNSIDDFLTSGIGYCCIEDNVAVSLSYTSFISDSYHEIGIETLDEYRKKGYAYSAASCVLSEVISKGKIPFWECTTDNIASAKTAQKLGFKERLTYTCFGFSV